MNQNLPFPDDVQSLTFERLGCQSLPQSFAEDSHYYTGRITEITFKGDNRMQFRFDDRKTGWISVYPDELAWMETGLATPFQMAVHYIKIRRVRGAANCNKHVQTTLFD